MSDLSNPLENTSLLARKVCIGANRYSSVRGKAAYMNCLDSYPAHEDSMGQFQAQIRITYDEYSLLAPFQVSVLNPVIVTMAGRLQVFAGQQSFACDKVISVEPFKPAASTSAAPAANNASQATPQATPQATATATSKTAATA